MKMKKTKLEKRHTNNKMRKEKKKIKEKKADVNWFSLVWLYLILLKC